VSAVLWVTVAAPAVLALAVRMTPRADRALAAVGALAAAAPAWVLLVAAADGTRAHSGFSWLPAAHGLDVGLRLDPLSAAMTATVASVGAVVMVYATGYFAGDSRRRSALAWLLAFLAAMQGLVLADGYLALLVFWELVGALSARLIAFNRSRPDAPGGAVRAFLTTRSADVGFYLAVLALFTATGTLAFGQARPEGALGALVGIGFVAAAAGKSAQAPLSTWLSGAMAGPTPVSALLHSATMVAAGVYLLMRSGTLLAGWPLDVAGTVGAITAVTAAFVALGQRDLKRVLAGSTASQLGLMFVGMAAGGPAVALFQLVVHAAGKAGLFLATGVFQHRRDTTELERLAGAGGEDRVTFALFGVCALSIAAVPPLAGFWSKEHIAAAAQHHAGWFVFVLVAAAGSAAYLLRPALILWRGPRGDGARVIGRAPMLAGVGALAAASVVLGAIGDPLRRLLEAPPLPTSTLALVLSLVAILAGAGPVVLGRPPSRALAGAALRELYLNHALRAVVQRPVLATGRLVGVFDRGTLDRAVDDVGVAGLETAAAADRVERRGIDATVDGLARAIGLGGARYQRIQSGRLYEYLRDSVLGVAGVAAIIALAALL
jgi:NADH-quinone oxidoreductase subunit L